MSTVNRQKNHNDWNTFESIVTKYAQDVLRLAYLLLHDKQEAEDVLQECLIKLVHRMKQKRFQNHNGSVKAFLMICTKNMCIDLLRKRNRNSFIDDADTTLENIPDTHKNPFEHVQHNDLSQQLDWALSTLTVKQRTILILFEVNGDRYQDIAQSLNISIESVRKTLYRTRKKMREILSIAEVNDEHQSIQS